MKILHLADLHLGKRVNEMSMIEDQKYILDQIITLIKEESVGIVLLCGDIYDKSIPTIEAIHLLDEFLDQLSKMAIKVLMISGNHDSIDRLSFGKSLFTRSNLYIASQFENEIEKITVKENGITVNFYMLPFVKSAYISHIFQLQTDSYEECFRYLIEHTKIDEEETNILLSHQFVTANKKNPELSDSETSSLGGIDNIDFLKQLVSSLFLKMSSNSQMLSPVGLAEWLTQMENEENLNSLKDMVVNKFMELSSIRETEASISPMISQIYSYVDTHLEDSSLTLKQIAENYLFMNVDYVSKKFYKETGQKFSQYLTAMRITRAKQLIAQNPEEPVKNIAEQVGCGNNPQYFSQLFKKQTGITPTDYIASLGH